MDNSHTTLGDVEELLRMNVLHPAGCEVCCREGLEGILVVGRRSRNVGRISCGRKSSRVGAREGWRGGISGCARRSAEYFSQSEFLAQNSRDFTNGEAVFVETRLSLPLRLRVRTSRFDAR